MSEFTLKPTSSTPEEVKEEVLNAHYGDQEWAEEMEPYLDVFCDTPVGPIEELIRITSLVGQTDSWENALAINIFRGDPEFERFFETFTRPSMTTLEASLFEHAMLRCFYPEARPVEDAIDISPDKLLELWQKVTFNLLQVDVFVSNDLPWLYGWAMHGVQIYQLQGRPRNQIWMLPCKEGAARRVERAVGQYTYVDELPTKVSEAMKLHGVGYATLAEVTRGLLKLAMDPKSWAHPTVEEMLAPDFDQRMEERYEKLKLVA